MESKIFTDTDPALLEAAVTAFLATPPTSLFTVEFSTMIKSATITLYSVLIIYTP